MLSDKMNHELRILSVLNEVCLPVVGNLMKGNLTFDLI